MAAYYPSSNSGNCYSKKSREEFGGEVEEDNKNCEQKYSSYKIIF